MAEVVVNHYQRHKIVCQKSKCFFDTSGLMLKKSGFPPRDIKSRIESAWNSVNLYDVLIVIFDVHRHLTRDLSYNRGITGTIPSCIGQLTKLYSSLNVCFKVCKYLTFIA